MHTPPWHSCASFGLAALLALGAGCGEDGRAISLGNDGGGPGRCASWVEAAGFLCTTCTVDGRETTECLGADCGVSNRCLHCADPKGHIASDCGIDYEELATAASSYDGGGTFNSCSTGYGFPSGSSTTCVYPGQGSCRLEEVDGGVSFGCRLPSTPFGPSEGKYAYALSVADLSYSDPEQAWQLGRPADLPPPGECVTERSQGDLVLCTTCTYADLSAVRSCHHPPAQNCGHVPGLIEAQACLKCAHEDGTGVTFCDPALD